MRNELDRVAAKAPVSYSENIVHVHREINTIFFAEQKQSKDIGQEISRFIQSHTAVFRDKNERYEVIPTCTHLPVAHEQNDKIRLSCMISLYN